MSEKQRRGRNSKQRGAAAERSLAKLLSEKFNLPVKRVARSGALKFFAGEMVGQSDNYRGDLQLECGKKKIRIEVKTRVKLPEYIVGRDDKNRGRAGRIDNFGYILSLPEFIALLTKGDLPDKTRIETVSTKKCKEMFKWFAQDDSDIVATKETRKHKWFFVVKDNIIDKIGGKYKC